MTPAEKREKLASELAHTKEELRVCRGMRQVAEASAHLKKTERDALAAKLRQVEAERDALAAELEKARARSRFLACPHCKWAEAVEARFCEELIDCNACDAPIDVVEHVDGTWSAELAKS